MLSVDFEPAPDHAPIDLTGIVSPDLLPVPGIYFGYPEEDYHRAFGLSASGTKLMRSDPMDFWARSILNPRYAEVKEQEEDTAAQLYGRALHKLVLEGKPEFDKCFIPPISKADYPDALDTAADMKNWIERYNEGLEKPDRLKKPAKKDDLIDVILAAAPGTPIWESIVESYGARNAGKTILKQDVLAEVTLAAKMISSDPNLKDIFTNGYPEVSLFYRCQKTGIPCKARYDFLRYDEITDLKSFMDMQMRPVDEAVRREMNFRGYARQAAWYLDAAEYIPAMIKAGRVFGDVDKAFLDKLLKHKGKRFRFVFSRKGPAPVARGRWFSQELGVYEIAKAENENTREIFAHYLRHRGAEPWLESHPTVDFTDDELNTGY